MECDAIIFDLDGVLIDSTAVVERHWQQWALKHNLDPDEIMRVAFGRRTAETIRLVAPQLDAIAEATRIAAAEAYDTDGLVQIEGAIELVNGLAASSWAVATSGTRDTAITRLNYAGLPVPSVLVTADDVKRGKPDPQAFLLAAERLQTHPIDCVVLEDSPAGIEAAKAAGMRVIAIETTHTEDKLQRADWIAERLSCLQVSPDDEQSNSSKLPRQKLMLTVRRR